MSISCPYCTVTRRNSSEMETHIEIWHCGQPLPPIVVPDCPTMADLDRVEDGQDDLDPPGE